MKKLVLVLLFLFIGNLNAGRYYVNSISGNNYNSGLDTSHAWQSIAKVDSFSFGTNDTISFKCGQRFSGYTLTPPRDNLTFNSYGTGEKPIIDRNVRSGDTTWIPCLAIKDTLNFHLTFNNLHFINGWMVNINISGNSYITFDSCIVDSTHQNFWVKNAPGNIFVGVRGTTASSYITIKNSIIKNSQHGHGGYFEAVNNLLLENDTVEKNGSNGIQTLSYHQFGVSYACYYDTIRYCTIRQNDIADQYQYQVFDNGMRNSAFYYNLLENNTTGVKNGALIRINNNYNIPPSQVAWYNNTCVLHTGGEAVDWGDTLTEGIDNITFRNNLYYLDNFAQYGMYFYGLVGSHNIITNNFYDYPSDGIRLFHQKNGASNTDYATISLWNTASGYEGNSIPGNPQFSNYGSGIYSILDSSSAIFGGYWVGLTKDILGHTVNNPPDIGAYQNQNSTYLSGTISSNRTIGGNIATVGNVNINSGVNLTLSNGANIRLFNGAFISGDGYMITQSTFKIDVQTWDKALFRSMSSSGGHPKLLWGAYPNTNYGTGGYGIYCSFGGTPFIVDTLSNNTFTWTDSTVTIGGRRTAHYYVVALNQNNQESGQSNSLAYNFTPDKRLVNNSKTTNIKFFNLAQNYPNPFNPTTEINYQLPEAGYVSLKIYDILGREVTTLVNEYKTEGSYDITFNASGFRSGIYICRLKVNDFESSKKMILIK